MKKKSRFLFYAFWAFMSAGAVIVGYDAYALKQEHKKLSTENKDIDTLTYVYHRQLVPMSDSSEAHFEMGLRYRYLHDTVNYKIEMKESILWDAQADSVINKYHFMELIKRYKYPVSQL